MTVHRAGGQAGLELVVQPVLDLLGRQPAEPVRAEPRQHVALEVAPVGLLRAGREPAGEGEEVLGPVRERDVSATRIHPLAACDVGLHLPEEPHGFLPATEGASVQPTERVAVPRPVAATALLDVPHV